MNKTLKKYIEHPIKDRYVINKDTYQERETGKTRNRTVFAWLPIYLGLPELIPLRGCKFTWFKKVTVVEKEVNWRIMKFDDGWSYQHYWSQWKSEWRVIDIIKKL